MSSYCPICNSKQIGKINRKRYFCGECCHEWTIEEGDIAVYKIAVDGTIVRLRNKKNLNSPSLQRYVV